MVQFYDKKELDRIKIQRKKALIGYLLVLATYALSSVGLCVWFILLPYNSPTATVIRLIEYPLTAAFIVFTFFYMGIKYKRIRRYHKMLVNLETGIRETSVGSFFEYENKIFQKDGVDVKNLIFLEWNKYKHDFLERKVLVLAEMDFPVFEENQNVKYVTQGNVLVEYEILPDYIETEE